MSEAKAGNRKIIATNKNASRLYTIHERLEAGLVLKGTEVKSMRQGMSNMSDAFVYTRQGEAYIANLNINPYSHGNRMNHEPLRVRKLLLHKKEIEKIQTAIDQRGRTIVAIQLYFNKGRVKVEIGVATGKKLHDKREDLKEKESKREISRVMKRSSRYDSDD